MAKIMNMMKNVKGWKDLFKMKEEVKEEIKEQGRLMTGKIEVMRKEFGEKERKWNKEMKELMECMKGLEKRVLELEKKKKKKKRIEKRRGRRNSGKDKENGKEGEREKRKNNVIIRRMAKGKRRELVALLEGIGAKIKDGTDKWG